MLFQKGEFLEWLLSCIILPLLLQNWHSIWWQFCNLGSFPFIKFLINTKLELLVSTVLMQQWLTLFVIVFSHWHKHTWFYITISHTFLMACLLIVFKTLFHCFHDKKKNWQQNCGKFFYGQIITCFKIVFKTRVSIIIIIIIVFLPLKVNLNY